MPKVEDTKKTQEKTVTKGTIMVSRHYPGSEEMTFEDLEIKYFETQPALVQAKYGLTINLKNYESARVDASVTLPCYVEEIPAAFNKAFEIAEERVKEAAGEAKEYAKNR